jgi:hypothetical protein
MHLMRLPLDAASNAFLLSAATELQQSSNCLYKEMHLMRLPLDAASNAFLLPAATELQQSCNCLYEAHEYREYLFAAKFVEGLCCQPPPSSLSRLPPLYPLTAAPPAT